MTETVLPLAAAPREASSDIGDLIRLLQEAQAGGATTVVLQINTVVEQLRDWLARHHSYAVALQVVPSFVMADPNLPSMCVIGTRWQGDVHGPILAGSPDLPLVEQAPSEALESVDPSAWDRATAVVFPNYVPDGPSYAGRVEVRLVANVCRVTTWRGVGQPHSVNAPLPGSLPDFAEELALTDERFKAAFDALAKATRDDYLEGSLQHLSRDRVRPVRFADGVEGAVMLWGECGFVSLLRFGTQGGTEISLEAHDYGL